MRPLTAFRCLGCGHVAYPKRLACKRCGGDRWAEEDAARGVVEESTVRRHRTYEEKRNLIGDWLERRPVHLVSVRTSAGPVVTARVQEELTRGAEVRLWASSGAPVAEAVGNADRAGQS
ncbi:MAG: hypothetical protein ACR2N5_04475 [Solirubrobacterales bacterium]